MLTLAIHNLFHDKVRLVVTLVGIVFALVLIVVQFGLFLGFLETSGNIVEHSNVDLWISAQGLPHVNGGSAIPERWRYKALAVEGVEDVRPYALSFLTWKLPSGATQAVQVVGFDIDSRLGGPFNLVEGSLDDLKGDDTVIIDKFYAKKLGVTQLGQTLEIANRRARVVGYTQGIRSFTTSPYVYASFKNSLSYLPIQSNQAIFLVGRLRKGASLEAVRREVQKELPYSKVFTNAEMMSLTQTYWVFGTGAGITTLIGAALGLLVGVVVVAQTIYSATVDHLREFGTLKAMGASNAYVYGVILLQAGISAVLGYLLSMSIAVPMVNGSKSGDALINMPPQMMAGMLGLAVVMCISASVLSIRKATTIDPAMVFRG